MEKLLYRILVLVILTQAVSFRAAPAPSSKRLEPHIGSVAAKTSAQSSQVRLIAKLVSNAGKVDRLVFSPDGQTVATSDSRRQSVRLWDAHSGELKAELRLNENLPNWFIEDPKRPTLPTSFNGPLRTSLDRGTKPVSVSPSGAFLLTQTFVNPKQPALEGITADVWELATGRSIATFVDLPLMVDAFWGAHENKIVAVGYARSHARLLDVGNGKIIKLALKGCTTDALFGSGGCESFVFSADERVFAKQAQPLRLLSANTGELVAQLQSAAPPIVFSPTNPRLLVTRSQDKKSALLWELPN